MTNWQFENVNCSYLKEAKEKAYWVLLPYKTDYLEAKAFDSLSQDITGLLKLLTSIINNTKNQPLS
jgi:four helix bundle protein